MDPSARALVLWTALLGFSAWRALPEAREEHCALCDPVRGPPVLVPDLAADGAERLAWLPGLGAGRAERLVRERPGLGLPLSVETLPLMSGIGANTQLETRAALVRWSDWRAAQASNEAAQR